MEALKCALGIIKSDANCFDIFDHSEKNPDIDYNNNLFDELQDYYLSEGSPDKLMMGFLKELNINGIKEFLNDNKLPDKPFQKKTHAASL